jgi:hypothetical protein
MRRDLGPGRAVFLLQAVVFVAAAIGFPALVIIVVSRCGHGMRRRLYWPILLLTLLAYLGLTQSLSVAAAQEMDLNDTVTDPAFTCSCHPASGGLSRKGRRM